ncbi:hypothetical protein M422DRAFT_36231, partial [Sphaerobolus stellatus SS14]
MNERSEADGGDKKVVPNAMGANGYIPGTAAPRSFHIVFPYMDHDVAGLPENERVKLTPSQIKLYMKQLSEGTAYFPANHIVHRDMKAANLLISNNGLLQIPDFGLARTFDPKAALTGKSIYYMSHKAQ